MKRLHVLIDDTRNLLNMDIICRTSSAAKGVLTYFGEDIEWLYLDHDLGEEVDGYQIAKWAQQNECLPSKIQLVTSNPVGRENIAALLVGAGYKCTQGINFIKESFYCDN